MTRSEEELDVDTMAPCRRGARAAPRGRGGGVGRREVRREVLEIEREPASRFDPPRRDAGEPSEALVMVLREERPVVSVEVVPTEVVRVRRAVVRGGERISQTRCAGSRSRSRAPDIPQLQSYSRRRL